MRRLLLGLLLLPTLVGCGPRRLVTDYGHPEVYAYWNEEKQECTLVIFKGFDEVRQKLYGGSVRVDASWCSYGTP